MAHKNFLIGTFVVVIGALCFGTMNVPIRRSRAVKKDVFFVQWMMSLGSLVFGFVLNSAMGSPPIHLEVTAGGILWTIANLMAQFALPNLGIATTLLLYSTTNILTGWSTGRFGLLGLKQKMPKHIGINLIGLITILMGGFAFAFIKRGFLDDQQDDNSSIKTVETMCTIKSMKSTGTIQIQIGGDEPISVTDNKASHFDFHKLLYILLSLIAGFFFSATSLPVLYIQDHLYRYPGAQRSGLNYIFSHYLGIFMSATAIFVVYAIAKKNRPTLEPGVALPSMISGAIWGCGMCCLFLANDLLTQTIAYPVMITIPCCVATLWSVFYFKDIQMVFRNILIITISFSLIFFGAILSFMSNL